MAETLYADINAKLVIGHEREIVHTRVFANLQDYEITDSNFLVVNPNPSFEDNSNQRGGGGSFTHSPFRIDTSVGTLARGAIFNRLFQHFPSYSFSYSNGYGQVFISSHHNIQTSPSFGSVHLSFVCTDNLGRCDRSYRYYQFSLGSQKNHEFHINTWSLDRPEQFFGVPIDIGHFDIREEIEPVDVNFRIEIPTIDIDTIPTQFDEEIREQNYALYNENQSLKNALRWYVDTYGQGDPCD